MKSILHAVLFLLMALFGFTSVTAQKSGFELSTAQRLLGGEEGLVFVLEVDRANEEDVAKAWKKMVEKKTKVKAQKKNDQTFIEGIIIESINPNPISIYSSAVQQDTSVRLYAVFIVDSVRVDPKGKEGTPVKVRKMLAKFGTEIFTEVLEREHEEKMDRLEELEKEHDKNLKAQDGIHKNIQRDSLKIYSAETEIDLLKGELKNTNERYTGQKSSMAGAKYGSKEEEKEAKSELKSIDKERKKIEKNIQSQSDEILKNKAEIRNLLYELSQLEADLKINEEKVNEQRKIIQEAEEEMRIYDTKKKSFLDKIF